MTLTLNTEDRAEMAIRSSTLTTPDGVQIGFESWGEGPPLVLIHGAFSNQRSNWCHIHRRLGEHFACHAISRRGRGHSAASRDHSLEEESRDAVTLIKSLNEPVRLLGHSYGALVALGAASIVPARVEKLVLYEAPRPEIVSEAARAFLRRLAELEDWEALAFHFFTDVLGVSHADMEGLTGTPDWQDTLTDTPASMTDLDVLSRYQFSPQSSGHLSMPVLLQIGSESQRDLYTTDVLRSVIPDSHIAVIEGEGHDAMTTAPDKYVRATLPFLLEG